MVNRGKKRKVGSRAEESSAPTRKPSWYTDYDRPQDIRNNLFNRAALEEASTYGCGMFQVGSSGKWEPCMSATGLEKSDADAWTSALDELEHEETGTNSMQRDRAPERLNLASSIHAPGGLRLFNTTLHSLASSSRRSSDSTESESATGVSSRWKRDLNSLSSSSHRDQGPGRSLKKSAGDVAVKWARMDGPDTVMCYCDDPNHFLL